MGEKIFLSCRKATEMVEKRQIAGLSCSEKIQLGMHNLMCGACKKYERQSHYIDNLLIGREKNIEKQHTDTNNLQRRIKKVIEDQTE
jgi:hypothetical protein